MVVKPSYGLADDQIAAMLKDGFASAEADMAARSLRESRVEAERMTLATRAALAEKRPYIIVGAFILGMLLTPPDVLSQTLLAVPMWLLFELGLTLSRFYQPRTAEESAEQEEKL